MGQRPGLNMEVSRMKMDSVQKVNEITPVQEVQRNEPKATAKTSTKEVENREKMIEQSREDFEANEAEVSKQITIDHEKLKKLVEQLKESVPNAEPKFGVHEATNRMMVKLVDKDTQKVIKEFPLEKTLDSLAKSLDIAGAMVDTKL